ncbi:Rpn family recombination-promoting nuclease/putative transposase [Desulfofundulus thermobenzoicus]|uniref:Rpn family recombination-promoting nuclease/putative transposase n=1 Tax=Desulfofundulus thermobenzoicus TaxID=29376 RepID=A0A6N7IUP1_9FIRM|nr:Rpn family recombination-promoting nuclease/putative transposase [Desulfofundulus thermobenzoicus]
MPDKRQPHHTHDRGYRELLSSKRAFLELLKTFVHEEWAKDIDEESLVRVEKSYVLQDFSEKEADIVYRLRLRGTEVIFYVLLELQSTVDHLMPFRLLLYMVEIWRDIYNNTLAGERERKGFRLPAIVPAVLYNGRRSWTACRSFREYQAGHERFPGYLLHPFRRRPLQRRGPVPVGQRGVQRVLPGPDRGEIHFLELEKIKKIKRRPVNALEAWMMYLNNLEGEEMEGIAVENPGIRKALTIEQAFWQNKKERRIYELREKALRDEISALAGARAEGRAEGEAKGRQEAICKYLDARFGDDSRGLQERVRQIGRLEALDKIINKIYTAGSLEEAQVIVDDARQVPGA